jgi:hypothetical protein
VLEDLREETNGMTPGTKVLLIDNRNDRANLDSAFGTLIQPAVDLFVAARPAVQIVPPPAAAIPPYVFRPEEAALRLTRRGTNLVAY